MKTRRAFPVVLVLLALTACNPFQPSTADAQAQLCKDLVEFRTAVATLTKADATTTVGQMKDARKQVQQEMSDLQKDVQVVKTAKVDDLQKAYGDLDRAINSIPNDMPLGQAVTTIQPQVRAVEATWTQLNQTAGCI